MLKTKMSKWPTGKCYYFSHGQDPYCSNSDSIADLAYAPTSKQMHCWAVRPSWSTPATSVRGSDSSNATTSICPNMQAACKTDWSNYMIMLCVIVSSSTMDIKYFTWFLLFTSTAGFFINSTTTSTWPYWHAKYNGVFPSYNTWISWSPSTWHTQ